MNDFLKMKDSILRILPVILTAILVPLAANAKSNKDCLDLYGKSRSFCNALEEYSNGNINATESFLKEEIGINPQNGLAYFYLALISWDRNDSKATFDYIDKAIKHLGGKANKKHKAKCFSLLGDICMATGNYPDAYGNYFKAINLDSSRPDYLEYISEASFAAGLKDDVKVYAERLMKKFPDRPYGFFSMGRYLMHYKDDPQGALCYFEQALGKDPDFARALDMKSLILMYAEKWDDAFPLLFRALEGGETKALKYAIGLEGDDFTRFEEYVAGHQVERKSNWRYSFVLYSGHMRKGLYNKAIPLISEVLALEPTEAEYDALSECYLMTGHLDKATEAIDMAIALSPEESVFIKRKAIICLLNKKPEKAMKILSDFIARHPENSDIAFAHSVFSAISGNTSGAMTELDRLISLQPDDQLLLYEKGKVCLLTLQNDEAMACFRKVVKNIRKDSPISSIYGALAYARLGDADKAIQIIDNLIDRTPKSGHVQYFSAMVHAIIGNDGQSLRHLQLAHANECETMPLSLMDYDFTTLRNNPEFRILINKLMPGLKETGKTNFIYDLF